jgi:type IV pilus assembly protein PilA
MKRRRMIMKNQKSMGNKGFSLVELIVVIAIMAVLVGVLAPQFIKYVEKSRVSTDVQNIEEVKTAIQTYAAENGFTAETWTIGATSSTKTFTATGTIATALTDAGLSTTLTLKSSNWSDVAIVVGDDSVKVYGSNSNGTVLTDGASAPAAP